MPQTPPARSKPPVSSKGKSSTRALRLPTPTGTASGRDAADIETFLDGITPIDMSNKENDRPEPPRPNYRDSHDLSLPARQVTRDSLVTNMLLSLDQFSMSQPSGSFGPSRVTYDDPSVYGGADDSRAMTFSSRPARAGGGHSYSYSSDFDGADDSSRISSQPSRGRRSNSSSGFQSNLGRISSMRETSHQRSIPGTPGPLHSRGGKTSKSSSTNSIDPGYAQVLGSQRWAQGFGAGAPSNNLDHEPGRTTTSANHQTAPWHIEFSNNFFNNDEYEAAPTPTVPGGPRRLVNVPSLPVLPPPPPPPEPKSPERKRSTRSSRSATVGARRSESKHGSGNNNNNRDALAASPPFDIDSAPAPHVGYEKSKEIVASPPPAPPQQPKEKQSFFRKLFGSSKNTNSGSLDQASPSPHPSFTSVETAVSRSHSKSSAPPSRESHHTTTHTLQKKTSSFFRRRKQSFTEAEPPPPLPIAAVAFPTPPVVAFPPDKGDLLGVKSEASPITSLRRAMDPFLHGTPTPPVGVSPVSPLRSSTQDAATPRSVPLDASERIPSVSSARPPRSPRDEDEESDRRRNVRGFSPDYEPSPKAAIRTVDPEPAGRLDRHPSSRNELRKDTPTREAPKPPTAASSFLQDNSDSESSPRRQRKTSNIQSTERGLRPVANLDRRTPSPSPSVVKSKSSPNLGRQRSDLAVPKFEDAILSPTSSRDEGETMLALPIEGIRKDGTLSDSKSPVSVPSLKVDSAEISPRDVGSLNPSQDQPATKPMDEPVFVLGDPTEDDRQKAQKIFDGNEDFIQKEKAAAWMGEEGPVRQRTLRAYIELYDFKNQSVVSSLRQICGRLVFRAETQQVDRILVAFSRRWCECNPNHGFKAMGM